MTAQQFVRRVRYSAQEMSTGTYRDGFSTDADTTSTLVPVLDFVNRAAEILFRTGIYQADFGFTITASSYRASMPMGAGRVTEVAVSVSGQARRPLRESTNTELTGQERNWRGTYGIPNVYITAAPELWFFPVPSTTISAVLRAGSEDPDLVNPTDVYPNIPYLYNGAVADLAAILVCSSDGENPARVARAEFLVRLFEMTYPDLAQMVQARSLLPDFGVRISRPEGGVQQAHGGNSNG